ncbi:MAG: hypothetical protein A3H63_02095 [Candidatus Harrisonbacteria bacterium RIFCSPLOWO2_02_FULL_45_10c]|uniref:DUF2029 domain-containing protein n=1 Tax=Candidatus Harrisonbacteria bacterium RIFCSPLOWO2_02_FULL_45_10c TaxID=1798410 RepID=A0A1G1ZUX7_9BACT|nr:MAG: hypothetical protein A3H63_02095 [Candidatus Harrisonbacteria bacterium RIFCSPLOWO2_02_FULL_45_10c]
MQPRGINFYLWLIAGIGILSMLFHGLGLFPSAPWQIVYSDVLGFFDRAAATGFPYLEKQIEYPVITGLLIHWFGQLGQTKAAYYLLSAAALVGMGVFTTYVLFKSVPESHRRQLLRYWIFAPSMLIFFVYNWDMIALLFVICAFYFMQRNEDGWAAVFLALGFSSKFFPALYLLPLLLRHQQIKEWIKIIVIFSGMALAINGFFLIRNFGGWYYFFSLNQLRGSNLDSIWTVIRFLFPSFEDVSRINAASLIIFLAGLGYLLWRHRRSNTIALCAAITVVFLLTNKVFTPQYLLWLLPFFIILPEPKRFWFYAAEFANLGALFAALAWFFNGKSINYFYITGIFVVVRHIALFSLLRHFLSVKSIAIFKEAAGQ